MYVCRSIRETGKSERKKALGAVEAIRPLRCESIVVCAA